MTESAATPTTAVEIEALILKTLNEHAGDSGPFSRETRILADTNFDSVNVMDFVLDLEDVFDVTVPLNRMAEIVTVDDLVKTIETLLSES
ncbi:MAG: acyl carrier protein [Alphaproteobacteria bacterium]|jgi:acyl carrier protein